MIKIKGLEKYFNRGRKNELHVLNGINLELENRGLVCILGESGSGKTTLLNTIGGLDVFASGRIEIDGTALTKYEPKKIEKIRNETFGYIFQNYYLLQDYTVLYNVKLALNTFELSEEEKEERALYVLEQLDMAKYKKKLVSQLSGGQQQRVSIARALVKAPKIILADEPTGNLDEENTLRTMSILKNISQKCLVILVSHEKRIARFFADRIIEIQDGKIIRDYSNRNEGGYQRMDDNNIYLGDLEHSSLESGGVQINLYQEESMQKKIRLNLAWKNGKLYFQNLENYDILPAGKEVGCEMLEGRKPQIEMKNIEEYEFTLPEITEHKTGKLAKKEIWKLAIENIRLMGKKQAFIIGILLLTAVMLTVTLANFTNSYFIKEEDIVTEDSHYVTVDVTSDSVYSAYEDGNGDEAEEQDDNTIQEFFEKYVFNGEYSDIYKQIGGSYMLQDYTLSQLQSSGIKFDGFSYVSLSHISEDDLIYGRMPEKATEIIVDKWLLNRVLEENVSYRELLGGVEAFLEQELVSGITGDTFTIVGISDNNEPSIYMDQYRVLGLSATGYRIATLEQLQAEYPGEYDDITLESHQVLLTQSNKEDCDRRETTAFSIGNQRKYEIVGAFPDAFGVDYVLSEEDCQEIRNDYILSTKSYSIYTDNAEETIAGIKAAAEQYSGFSLSAFSKRDNEIRQYKESNAEQISGRNLIAVAAVLVSLFMIYFMIKSNVSQRTEELTVYRLLGIAKGSILKSYMLEMFLITSYTALPAILLTSGMIKFIGSVPSLELEMTFPWLAVAALAAAMYLFNILISILPVWGTLSKPPAVLAAKKL